MDLLIQLIGTILFFIITRALLKKKNEDAMGVYVVGMIWLLSVYAITVIFWIP